MIHLGLAATSATETITTTQTTTITTEPTTNIQQLSHCFNDVYLEKNLYVNALIFEKNS